jgi:hypothetical protein
VKHQACRWLWYRRRCQCRSIREARCIKMLRDDACEMCAALNITQRKAARLAPRRLYKSCSFRIRKVACARCHSSP